MPQYLVSEQNWLAVHSLADERYRIWAWNYSRSPDFNLQRAQRSPCGEIDARLGVLQGIIRVVKLYGDFLPTPNQRN